MIFDALSWSRRWTTVTREPNRARNRASSMAVSPPPTTTISWSRKKNPSQVAQYETPRPAYSRSPLMPRLRGEAPVATITARARSSRSSVQTPKGRAEKSTRVTSPDTNAAPKRAACLRNSSINSGPWTPSGKPG